MPKSVFLPDGTKWLEESDGQRGARRGQRLQRRRTPPGVHGLGLLGASVNGTELAPKRATGVSAPKKRRKSKSRCRTRANRPRTGSPSRSRSTATRLSGTIRSIGAGRNRDGDDPADAGAERRSDARSRSRTGARRAGLRKQRSQLHGRLRIGDGRSRCGSPTSARPEPSPRTRCGEAAAGGRSSSRCGRRRSTTRSSPSSGARPSGRWCRSRTRSRARCGSTLDTLAFEAEAVTIVGEHDFRVRAHLIAREGVELERGRGGPLPSPAARPVRRASCASSCPGSNGAASAAPPRRCGWSASRSRPWAAIGARAAAELYGCDDPARGDRGRGRQRHPLRLDRARAGPRPARAGPGRPRWSSPSSAKTTPAPWSTRCASSPTAAST